MTGPTLCFGASLLVRLLSKICVIGHGLFSGHPY
jgi:hypothetical protein